MYEVLGKLGGNLLNNSEHLLNNSENRLKIGQITKGLQVKYVMVPGISKLNSPLLKLKTSVSRHRKQFKRLIAGQSQVNYLQRLCRALHDIGYDIHIKRESGKDNRNVTCPADRGASDCKVLCEVVMRSRS